MEDNDSLKTAAWLAIAGTLAAGVWKLLTSSQKEETLKMREDIAWDRYQKASPKHPFDFKAYRETENSLGEYITLREIRERREAGYDSGDPQLDATLGKMARNLGRNDDDFMKATDEFLKYAGQVPPEVIEVASGHNQAPSTSSQRPALTCGYCNGVGWYHCSGCQGSGKNRLISPPRYTGNEEVDALLSIQYQRDSICRACQGQGTLVCNPCQGKGY